MCRDVGLAPADLCGAPRKGMSKNYLFVLIRKADVRRLCQGLRSGLGRSTDEQRTCVCIRFRQAAELIMCLSLWQVSTSIRLVHGMRQSV